MKKVYSFLLAIFAVLSVSATDYYLTGDFNGWNPAANRFSQNADGSYEITVSELKGEIKVLANGNWGAENEYCAVAADDALFLNDAYALKRGGVNLKVGNPRFRYRNAKFQLQVTEGIHTLTFVSGEEYDPNTYQIVGGFTNNWNAADAIQFEKVDGVLTALVSYLNGGFKIISNRSWDEQWATNRETNAGLELNVPYVMSGKIGNDEPANLTSANPFGSYFNAKLTLQVGEDGSMTLTLVDGTFDRMEADWYITGALFEWECTEQQRFVPEGEDNNQPGDNDRPGLMTYVTTADGTMRFTPVRRVFSDEPNTLPERTLTFNPQVTYQELEGFGAAITGATAYNLMKMPADKRKELLTEAFSVEDGMGYGYVRVPIGGCDFNSRSNYDYTCCDQVGIENFALQSDELDYIIPILTQILTINPNLKIMAAPWSCPTWMKVDDIHTKAPYSAANKWVGGYLNPDYYQDYATYFVKWIRAFEAYGIQITAVTPQNEPLNWGNSMSLYMPWDQERDFVKMALGPTFEREGINTKIICYDHNYNYDNKQDQMQYPLKIYADAEASRYIDGAAYHSYGGNPTELDAIHNAAPNKDLYFTEQSIGTWNYQSFGQSLMSEMKNTCIGTVTRWCKAVIVWNFLLDDQGGPHGGPGACSTCYGAVDVSSRDYVTLTKRSHFYAIGHLSKALKQGSTRIATSGYLPFGVSAVASQNPDGSYGLVLLNENNTKVSFNVASDDRFFEIVLPAESVTSLVFPSADEEQENAQNVRIAPIEEQENTYEIFLTELGDELKLVYGSNWALEFGATNGQPWELNEEYTCTFNGGNIQAIDNEARYTNCTITLVVDYENAEVKFTVVPEGTGEPTSLQQTKVEPVATKIIENGQVLIIKDGVRYNMMGVKVD